MPVPDLYFYSQKSRATVCSLDLMIFIVSPKHAQRSCAKSNSGNIGRSHPSQAVQPTYIDPKKRFARFSLHKQFI